MAALTNVLDAVACPTPTNCVAVGDYYDRAGVQHVLAEAWDGTAWSVVPSPSPGTLQNSLDAVSCPSETDCVAVGTTSDAAVGQATLVESWDGTTWSVVPSPDADVVNVLLGVSCSGPDACVAVGSSAGESTTDRTLVESWDGTTWSITASPSPGTGATLVGVSCTGPGNCSGVGNSENASGVEATLVEFWNGTAWTVVASPSPGSDDAR